MNISRITRASRIVLFAVALIAVRLAPAFAAGVSETYENGAPIESSRQITDMRGRVIEVPAHIDSIVALGASSLRMLTYFDAIEKVVAVEDAGHAREKTVHDFFYLATYRIAHPELQELPSIGSQENHEAIIAGNPDIVFSSTVDVAALDQLQNTLGIPVFAIDADVEVAGIEDIVADLNERAERVSEPKRGYAGGMMFYGPADLLRTTGDYAPFDYTNTTNVMPTNPVGNLRPYMTSLEELISADPDYVFIDSANYGLSLRGYEANRDVLDENVAAFANGEVYTTLVYKYYGTNWENQIINIYYVGSVLYPDVFADVSPVRKAEEIWDLFFQVPLTYDEVMALHGPGMGRANW